MTNTLVTPSDAFYLQQFSVLICVSVARVPSPTQIISLFENDPAIFALWDNLVAINSTVSKIYTENIGGVQYIQWHQAKYDTDAGTSLTSADPITFQVALFTDGRIQFNYKSLDSLPSRVTGQAVSQEQVYVDTGGIDATVGIWSGTPQSIQSAAGKFVPGLHNIVRGFGDMSLTEATDSIVRMAWETGGAVFDGRFIVDAQFPGTSFGDSLLSTFESNFAFSLGNQVARKVESGQAFVKGQVVAAINYGGNGIATEGFANDSGKVTSGTGLNVITTTQSVTNPLSNSIPLTGPIGSLR